MSDTKDDIGRGLLYHCELARNRYKKQLHIVRQGPLLDRRAPNDSDRQAEAVQAGLVNKWDAWCKWIQENISDD